RNRVEVRVSTGEAPRYELIRADTELLTAQKNADAAVLRIVQAKARLRALVAGQLPEEFELQGELERDFELSPLGQLRDDMLARNPEIFRLKAEIDRFTEQRELEKLRRMPDVSLKLARDRDPEYEANRIGVAVTIPIFDRRQGPIAQAGAQVERTRLQLENRLFQLQQQLDAAYRVAEAAYRFGERGILDFLDAQRVFRAVRNELISARYELSAAVVEIERLSAVR
ncbi:MAG: hypothetical protein B7Z51_11385, partial [Methyloversatilis sp. 12-65-5]